MPSFWAGGISSFPSCAREYRLLRRLVDGDEDPGKIRFIVPKFWEKNRMRSEKQPFSTVLQYGCVALRMRFVSQNFGTIK